MKKSLSKILLQILAPPEGASVILEFQDERGDAFMEVGCDASGERRVTIFRSSEDVTMPLSELKKGIEIAERRVVAIDVDALFEEN